MSQYAAGCKEIELLESANEERFEMEKLARREMESRLLKKVEDKFMFVRKALSLRSKQHDVLIAK